jgi:hypothetical protein
MRLIAAALALALGTPGPAGAQASVNRATDAAITAPTAAALARAVAPSELMVPLEVDVGRQAILSLASLDDDAKALEAEYPGIWQAVWNRIEPEVRRYVEADYPKFWSRLEALYSSRLTESEAQALLAFYRSPTGQKMLRTMLAGQDSASFIAGVVSSENGTVSAEQLRSATQASRLKAVQSIGPADDEQLNALMNAISLDKFRAVGADTQRVTLEWVNEEDPAFDANLEKLMKAALEAHMAKGSPEKSSR